MLLSLLVLATYVLSTTTLVAESWTAAPRDPSTLTLALIAIGTLAMYGLATRRPRRPARDGIAEPRDGAARSRAVDAAARASRDAA